MHTYPDNSFAWPKPVKENNLAARQLLQIAMPNNENKKINATVTEPAYQHFCEGLAEDLYNWPTIILLSYVIDLTVKFYRELQNMILCFTVSQAKFRK